MFVLCFSSGMHQSVCGMGNYSVPARERLPQGSIPRLRHLLGVGVVVQEKTVLLGRHDLSLKDFSSRDGGSHSVNRDHGDDMTPITAIRRNRNWKIGERENASQRVVLSRGRLGRRNRIPKHRLLPAGSRPCARACVISGRGFFFRRCVPPVIGFRRPNEVDNVSEPYP
jgi:hypothetical protein